MSEPGLAFPEAPAILDSLGLAVSGNLGVVILSGLPGAGKTTLARGLTSAFQKLCGPPPMARLESVSADDEHMKNGSYRFDPARAGEAHRMCLAKYLYHVGTEDTSLRLVVVDNTNVSPTEIAPYYRVAEAWGWKALIVRLYCEPMVAFRRNVHGVSLATILTMYRQLLTEPLPPYWNYKLVSSPG